MSTPTPEETMGEFDAGIFTSKVTAEDWQDNRLPTLAGTFFVGAGFTPAL